MRSPLLRSAATLAVALGLTVTATPALAKGKPGQDTVADIVVTSATAAEPEFTILMAALQAVEQDAGLIAALSGRRPFTVFAPTDAAFAALLVELGLSAEELLADTPLVEAVLRYHVTKGRRFSQSVVGAEEVRMLDGNFVHPEGITLVDGRGRLINLDVPDGIDLKASNGIVHVIDRVMLPPVQ